MTENEHLLSGAKVAAVIMAARAGLEDSIPKVKKYMSDLWGNAVAHCPKVVQPEGANVPTLEDSENVLLENRLATEQPTTTEAVSLVMSVICEDVAEEEILFAYKLCRLTTVFAKAMKELHLTETKMKKLTEDNIKLASELRTVISDYDLFVQRFPITKLFCIC